MKSLILAVAVMFAVGCKCSDGHRSYDHGFGMTTTKYAPCEKTCCTNDFGRHDDSKCGCSNQCPCR